MKNGLCTNLAVAPGVDVDHVVSAVVVAAVHEDGVQDVGRRVLLVGVLQVLVQVQPFRELEPVKERHALGFIYTYRHRHRFSYHLQNGLNAVPMVLFTLALKRSKVPLTKTVTLMLRVNKPGFSAFHVTLQHNTGPQTPLFLPP